MHFSNRLFKPQVILFSTIIFFTASVYGQPKKLRTNNQSTLDYTKIKQLAYNDSSRLVEIFKDIHLHPEIGFTETRTAAIIAKELQALGYKVITGIGKTGVAGILKNGEGPVVMYRADMDALPVKEATGLSYASTAVSKKTDGTEVPVMHACGHDAHVTWMLGVARIMTEMKSNWKGTIVFAAQPAEELGLGAEAMVKDNMYGKGVPLPDYLFGIHTKPLPVGTIENCSGVRMAGNDQFDVTFRGIGGHGSAPHLTKDPVVMAATAILDYQAIVHRSVSSQNPHVITVGSVMSGSANNIIPNAATLKINLRWFTEADRSAMINGINRVDSSIAFAFNVPADLYPEIIMKSANYPVTNDSGMVYKINSAFAAIVPPVKMVSSSPASMVSEDFPNLIIHSNKGAPYDFMYVGIANPAVYSSAVKEGKEFPFYYHSPTFVADLSAIPFGTMIGTVALLEMFRK